MILFNEYFLISLFVLINVHKEVYVLSFSLMRKGATKSNREELKQLKSSTEASITDSTKSVEITTKNGYCIQSSEFRATTDYAKNSGSSATEKAIKLNDVAYGWGNGAHPTTRLCLDFIIDNVKPGDMVLDYGTGSGLLSIMAAKLGATRCIGVDIDEDTILAAQHNVEIHGVENVVEIIHTKEIYVGEDKFPICDVTVANILPGPLSRLVAAIWSFTKPGGLLCISGLRPNELKAIKTAYAPIVNMNTSVVNNDSHPIYGEWVSWTVNMKIMNDEELRLTRALLTELTHS